VLVIPGRREAAKSGVPDFANHNWPKSETSDLGSPGMTAGGTNGSLARSVQALYQNLLGLGEEAIVSLMVHEKLINGRLRPLLGG